MCGFFGIFSLDQTSISIDESTSRKVKNSLLHRGPDSFKIEEKRFLKFYSARLTITDRFARADMPFTTLSGDHTLVYNGEIYNFKSLRKDYDLPEQTYCDTEVLAELFERKGYKSIQNLILSPIFIFLSGSRCIAKLKSSDLTIIS